MDIVEFLRARLDEDEAVAQYASTGETWDHEKHYDGLHSLYFKPSTPQPDDDLGEWDQPATATVYALQARHIVRHQPARVLREVEAKRRILNRLEDQMVVDYVWTEYQEVTLPLLALPYADHPDYDEEWKS